MSKTQRAYVLTSEVVYDYDESLKAKVFTNKQDAIKAFEELVDDTQNCYKDDNGNLPRNITGMDPDDLDESALEDTYVIEQCEINNENFFQFNARIYQYQNYWMDHVSITLQEVPVDGTLREYGLRKGEGL